MRQNKSVSVNKGEGLLKIWFVGTWKKIKRNTRKSILGEKKQLPEHRRPGGAG
jgi:hypothetical protein